MRSPALLIKDYTFMLLFSSIFSALTWLPFWALSAPPSQNCLCPAPNKEPWAPLPIVFSLSRQTPLLLQILPAVWYLGPLSHYSPRTSSLNCWCFTARPSTLTSEIPITTKNSGMRQLICIISIGTLKTKSFCNNFSVRSTETIVRQKNLRNSSCKIYLKAFILSYHNVAKETKYSFPFV